MRKSNGRITSLAIPTGRAIVTFETPYAGNRAELARKGTGGKGTDVARRGGASRVEFHAFQGEHAVYFAMAHGDAVKRANREVTERELQLCEMESSGRQYAVTQGGMRVRVK